MIKVYIDGIEVIVEKGSTVLQACEAIGIEIPRFCYHERLGVAGNCRMCLVEIAKTPKPVSSCTMPTMPGMVIFTDTPMVKKAREAVLEFLLINHPLDCAVCDQGGECDLQDQSLAFGSDRSRFYETKRSVEDKDWGPLIKTVMTRCIHCTRCIRFATEIAGVEVIGTTGRGTDMEVGTYIKQVFNSELSGNVIDLCPVGALTSKPYAFVSRPWELRSTHTIDTTDGLGSHLRIDSRGTEILRVLPRFSKEINEEWITDKARFSFDGLEIQRLTTPLIREGTSFKPVKWEEAFSYIQTRLKSLDGHAMHGVLGQSTDSETAFVLRKFLQSVGSSSYHLHDCPGGIDHSSRDQYSLNPRLVDIPKTDLCLLLGIDTRFEASLLNLRLRKRYLEGSYKVASIGPAFDATYPIEHLGTSLKTLVDIVEGKSPFCKDLYRAKNPIIICGTSLTGDVRHSSLEALLSRLRKQIPALGITGDRINQLYGLAHTGSNTVGLMDLGLSQRSNLHSSYTCEKSAHFLVGTDSKYHNQIARSLSGDKKSFIIYIGYSPADCTEIADVILPGLAFTEKQFLSTNTEGRNQEGHRILNGNGLAREDWKIISALSEFLSFGPSLSLHHRDDVRLGLKSLIPSQNRLGVCDSPLIQNVFQGFSNTEINVKPLSRKIRDFYLTDETTRMSKVMATCSSVFTKNINFI